MPGSSQGDQAAALLHGDRKYHSEEEEVVDASERIQ